MFIKYPKIPNIQNKKDVQRFFDQYPELSKIPWIVQEKIDGANLQVEFDNEQYRLVPYKRSGPAGNDFFGVGNVLTRDYNLILDIITHFAFEYDTSDVVLCGELFGDSIQNRIKYHDGKHFRFYDVKVNGEFVGYEVMTDTLCELSDDHWNMLVGVVDLPTDPAWVATLDELVKIAESGYFEKKPSLFSDDDSQIMEGVVAKPLNPVYDKGTGSPFMFKIKRSDFDDKGGKSKRKDSAPVSQEAIELNAVFQTYINKNRLLDLFGKHGEIENQKEIGEYIGLMMKDALEDFGQDYGEKLNELPKNEQKFVKSVQNEIVKMLREYV